MTTQFLSEADVITLRNMCRDLNDQEFDQYLAVVERRRLDPFTRQIYYTKRGGKMQVEATIDGLRVIAERSGEYAGQEGPFWCGPDGTWVDVWLKKENPAAAKIGVHKNGFKGALFAVANWDGYVQNGPTWKSLGPLMLSKVAESLALRKAFPQDMSGLYTREEMSQADEAPATEVPVTKAAPRTSSKPPAEPVAAISPPVNTEVAKSPETTPVESPVPVASVTPIRELEVVEEPTPEQRVEFKGHVKRLGLSKDGAARMLAEVTGGKDPASLSKKDVQAVIDYLKGL